MNVLRTLIYLSEVHESFTQTDTKVHNFVRKNKYGRLRVSKLKMRLQFPKALIQINQQLNALEILL
jgi:hypothetical protein